MRADCARVQDHRGNPGRASRPSAREHAEPRDRRAPSRSPVRQGADGSKVGARKLRELKENSNYFRDALVGMGLHVYGDHDSPVIPVLLYNPTKIAAFSRECLKRGLAVVTVGFPATPIIKSRARFCVSAGHKRADLEAAIATIGEVAELCKLRYSVSTFG